MRRKTKEYKKSRDKRNKRIALLKKLCRENYKITNKILIEKLEISKTEFYRNYKVIADVCRADNKKEALF